MALIATPSSLASLLTAVMLSILLVSSSLPFSLRPLFEDWSVQSNLVVLASAPAPAFASLPFPTPSSFSLSAPLSLATGDEGDPDLDLDPDLALEGDRLYEADLDLDP